MQIVATRTLTTRLAAPALSALSAGATQVNLTWSAPTPTGQSLIAGRRLYRATSSSGPWSAQAPPSGTTASVSGLTTGTTYYFYVEYYDQYGTGQPSNIVSCVPVAPGTGHRFYPGHYVFFTPNRMNVVHPVTQTLAYNQSVQASLFALIDSIAGGRTGFKGIQLILPWKEVEGPERGNYTRLFEVIDPVMAKLASVSPPKNLILQIFERGFVGNTASITLPEYIISAGEYIQAPGTTTYSGGLKCCASIWHAATMTDFINLGKAINTRYGDNARLAMFCGGETSLGFPDDAGTDFTQSAYNTQLRRCFTELKTVFTKTPLRLNANFYDSAAGMKSLIDFCHTTVYTGGIVVGGPDPEFDLPLPADLANAHRTITTNEVFRGNTQIVIGTDTEWQQGGGTNYRGRIPFIGEWQEFGMSEGRVGYNESVSDIYNYYAGAINGQNVMNASYHVWLQQNYKDPTTAAGNQQWAPYPNSTSNNGVKYFVETTLNGAVALSNPAIFEGNWV